MVEVILVGLGGLGGLENLGIKWGSSGRGNSCGT